MTIVRIARPTSNICINDIRRQLRNSARIAMHTQMLHGIQDAKTMDAWRVVERYAQKLHDAEVACWEHSDLSSRYKDTHIMDIIYDV